LHTPKCGGTWVWRSLEAAGVKLELLGDPPPLNPATYHLDLSQTAAYADRFTVAFVRHPLDFWRSWWVYRMRTESDPDRRAEARVWSEDFNSFAEQLAERWPGALEERFARYIGPAAAPIAFIGRFETLADDLVLALRDAGDSFDEQALRSHPPDNVNDYDLFPALYRPETAALLAESERAVIERFYPADPIPTRLLTAPRGRSRWSRARRRNRRRR
jgi:hypothetical protein